MRSTFTSALLPMFPEPAVDQGDPFLFEVPAAAGTSSHPYLLIVTSPGFPAYGCSDPLDPASWERLGDSFPGIGVDPWAWAPCVRHIPELARPWVMLYSLAAGAGTRVATSSTSSGAPTAPFPRVPTRTRGTSCRRRWRSRSIPTSAYGRTAGRG